MAPIRLLMVGVLFAAALAGCTSSQKNLDSVYGSDATNLPAVNLPGGANNTSITVIAGVHLQARLNEGAWGGNTSLSLTIPPFASPAMTGPSPQGGGGETTALPKPGNVTLDVRITEFASLDGYTASWYLVVGNVTNTPVQMPATGTFETKLPAGGHYTVGVTLAKSTDEASPVAVYAVPITGTIKTHWTVTGEVQPVRVADPSGMGVIPSPTSRDAMVDKYTLDLPAGVTVTAVTMFDGAFTPGKGTDVDLGIYGASGAGIACTGAGGPNVQGQSYPDPTQANENLAYTTDASGLWSVQVGAQADGCGGQTGWSYSNAGAVPYKLDITLG